MCIKCWRYGNVLYQHFVDVLLLRVLTSNRSNALQLLAQGFVLFQLFKFDKYFQMHTICVAWLLQLAKAARPFESQVSQDPRRETTVWKAWEKFQNGAPAGQQKVGGDYGVIINPLSGRVNKQHVWACAHEFTSDETKQEKCVCGKAPKKKKGKCNDGYSDLVRIMSNNKYRCIRRGDACTRCPTGDCPASPYS